MNISLTLRTADPEDADRLSALAMRSKAHWGYSATFMSACKQELAVTPEKILDADFDYVLAEDGQTVMGFYALERLSSSQFELEVLFVDPRYLGQGDWLDPNHLCQTACRC
ncbi:MAG: GNAT family N-acetyltransferase [Leptolyngbya sp. SIOISBB]|nr:GNAT family N-acetyltransferase [Leptolyngbya sp. SIOISBB]